MRVQSHFEAAPGMAAIGLADIDIEGPPQQALNAFAEAAQAAGWTVHFFHFDGSTADLPPRRFRMCIAEARQGERTLQLALEAAGRMSRGRLHWTEGQPQPPTMAGATPGGC